MADTGSGNANYHIVLVGHFDPASVAQLVGEDRGKELALWSSAPGVPIHHIASAFRDRGIQTTLLGGIQGSKALRIQSSPISVIVYPKRGRIAWIVDGLGRERDQVSRFLREIRPSIVHAHWTREGARAVADWDGPKVLTVHDAAWECVRIDTEWHWGPLGRAWNLRLLANTSAVLKRFEHIIAVSPFVESYLRLRHRYRGEIRVIPNAIPPLPASVQVVDTFPKTGSITFGAYGGPGRTKNIIAALRAFASVYKRLPNSRLLVYGTGWDGKTSEYANLPIEFRGAKPHAVFLGELGAQVDVWVHPSRIEAHPLTVCEAIQAGCSVIAGRGSGGVAWTLDYGRAGILVDIEKPGEIADAMLKLVLDRDKAHELISYGRKMISERFGFDRVVRMHLEYYKDIIDKASP